MPDIRQQRRQKLFRRFSKNLEFWRPELKGQYACPLCLATGFTEDSVLAPNPFLTEEHSIPNGLGAPNSVLTCATCNNTAGTAIDNHLHKRLEYEGFLRGSHKRPLNIRMEVAGQNLGVEASRKADSASSHIQITVIAGQSNPDSIAKAEEALSNGDTIGELTMQFKQNCIPNIQRSRVALLKSAYLLTFRHFGYGYIFSDVLDPVRQTIKNPAEEQIPLEGIILDVPIGNLPPTISFITAPNELVGFAVPIVLPTYGVGHIVIMPNDTSTFSRWKRWRQEHGDPADIKLKCKPIPFDEAFFVEKRFGWCPTHSSVPTEESTP